MFFVLDRVISRSLSLCIHTPALFNASCSLPFSICSYVIELLDSSHDDNDVQNHQSLKLFSILNERDLYLGIEKLTKLDPELEQHNEESNPISTLSSSLKKDENISSTELNHEPEVEMNDVVEYANAIGADLAISTMALAGAAG